jgi:SAM-dependent methyltransferase
MGESPVRADTSNHARRLWWEGLRCGLLNLAAPLDTMRLRHAMRLCLCPVDLWRYVEFQAVLDEYDGERLVLDVGSPKLLALVFARWFGTTVLASDIAKRIGPEVAVYARATERGRLVPQVFDAAAMPLADNSVPFVYSVSAIEHIGGDGDTQAVSEFGRVLRPGGKAVVTVPMGPKFREIWVNRDPYGHQKTNPEGKVFFSYVYDWAALDERIIKPSGLTLTRLRVWEENPPGWYETTYVPRTMSPAWPRSIATKLLDPHWAHTRLRARTAENRNPILGRAVAAVTLAKAGPTAETSR